LITVSPFAFVIFYSMIAASIGRSFSPSFASSIQIFYKLPTHPLTSDTLCIEMEVGVEFGCGEY
jgi:hypothetical protein